MPRYFVHDLESDKLLIFTSGKADWLTIPEVDREIIKRACLWSKSRNCWLSRSAAGRFWQRDVLTRNGFENRGTVGERLPFAERVEARQEKAEARAERMADRVTAAQHEASARFDSPNVKAVRDLQGEPVHVGHHSEKRHRRLLEKADQDMDKGCEAMRRRDHYQHRAAVARATAEGAQYSDPAFLSRRIKEQEAEERQLLQKLEGKFYAHSDPAPITDDYRERLTVALDDCRDKLQFCRHCLETCGRVVFTRESLKGKSAVLIRGSWYPIVRLNPTTVAVPNTCFPTEESQRKWALKYAYAEVKDAR